MPTLGPALTTFLSAFLLFQVQPLLARALLPWFGGGASVWTTCVLFFQVGLLAGYAYAHVLVSRLSPRRQAWVHVGLLALSLLTLPILPDPSWAPHGAEAPALRILLALAATVGLPYVALSATSPLLSAWYARRTGDPMPYWLYAVSNAASLLALLTYPVLVEPHASTRMQAWLWSGAYAVFVLACARVALRREAPAAHASAAREVGAPAPGWATRLAWVVLPALTTGLLLAVTAHLTQNVAPFPLLWVVPLALYLLSYVLCFARGRWYVRALFLPLAPLLLGAMAWGVGQAREGEQEVATLLPLFCAGLFVLCMAGHGELARLRPPARHLTGFFLSTALGGALGGALVALVAPAVLDTDAELPLLLAAFALLLPLAAALGPGGLVADEERRPLGLALVTVSLLAAVSVPVSLLTDTAAPRLEVRNFYGALQVTDGDEARMLTHGTISHGEQLLAPERRREPTTYYGPPSGVGRALRAAMAKRPALHVGVVGLGAGTLAAYGRAGDRYRFYELDPLVLAVAAREFTFLADTPARVDVVLGDARLSLTREAPQGFDVLAVDAFTSDAIPVHLLTREAVALYLRHLAPQGVLALHVSNRHLALEPIVAEAVRALGAHAVLVDSEDGPEPSHVWGATWVLVAREPAPLDDPLVREAAAPLPTRAGLRGWADDYSNLFQVIRWRPHGG